MLEPLVAAGDARRYFLATYQRTTRAVGEAIDEGLFEDGPWVEAWDVAFADLYLDAASAERPAGPWRQSLLRRPRPATAASRPARHQRTHQLRPPAGPARRDHRRRARRPPSLVAPPPRDHERIDEVLSARVTAEDDALAEAGPRSLDRPVAHAAEPGRHQAAAARGSAEGLGQHRTLSCARRTDPETYARRLADLEAISAERVADLMARGRSCCGSRSEGSVSGSTRPTRCGASTRRPRYGRT